MRTHLATLALLTATAICLTGVAASADAPTPASPRPWLAQPSTPMVASGTTLAPSRSLALLALVAVAGGVALLARKRLSRSSPLASRPRLTVLDTIRVAEKSHLVLARVGERCLLLGVTPHSVRRIAWLKFAEGAPEQEALAQPEPDESKDREGFPGLLRQAFVQDSARASSSDESPASVLAATTKDHVDAFSSRASENQPLSSSGPRVRPQARGKSAAAEAKMASIVEAQASGLAARRRR